jgi:Glyoxalase-like domain
VLMAARFYQLVVDAHDPSMLGHWWAEVLGYDVLYETADEVIIGTDPDRYPGISFFLVGDAKITKNRLHIDLDPDDLQAEVARITGLGAMPADVGQDDVPWTVLTDPEGNEFCILTPHKSLVE